MNFLTVIQAHSVEDPQTVQAVDAREAACKALKAHSYQVEEYSIQKVLDTTFHTFRKLNNNGSFTVCRVRPI